MDAYLLDSEAEETAWMLTCDSEIEETSWMLTYVIVM